MHIRGIRRPLWLVLQGATLKKKKIICKVLDNNSSSKLNEFLPDTGPSRRTRQALLALSDNNNGHREIEQFLSFCSLFLPKLVVEEGACLQKVQHQIVVHREQDLTQCPQGWNTPDSRMIIFRVMKASFTFKFMLIHQGINLVAGQDPDNIIITNSVTQARFSGLLPKLFEITHWTRTEIQQLSTH